MEILHGQEADHGKNESNKSDFNEALEHNLEGKTSEKDRVSPEKSKLLVVFADLRKPTNKVLLEANPLSLCHMLGLKNRLFCFFQVFYVFKVSIIGCIWH